jgi:RNA polymerase sigma-70 factor (ECF subfamily)
MIHTETFEQHRPHLMGIAYRLLGSVMEAEDMVQETFLRYEKANPAGVQNLQAYLTTIITHLCLDQLRSAQAKRETYLGPWLPEPLVTGDSVEKLVAKREMLSWASLVLLDKLSPIERAVFVLRELFEYSYPDIAECVDKSEANCRQIFHRAKGILDTHPAVFTTPTQHQEVLQQFLMALAVGDTPAVLQLLAPQVTHWSDGGGKAQAATRPLVGADVVARFWLGLAHKRPEGLSSLITLVNGEPTFVMWVDGQLHSAMQIVTDGVKIYEVRSVLNPDKLHHLSSFIPHPS